jgi:hypothetical protein
VQHAAPRGNEWQVERHNAKKPSRRGRGAPMRTPSRDLVLLLVTLSLVAFLVRSGGGGAPQARITPRRR